MKMITLIGLLCGAALSAQSAQFTPDMNVYGDFVTPTRGATVDQLSQDPWWGSSDLAFYYAAGYAQALFNRAKYGDGYYGLAEQLGNVYFAFNAIDSNNVVAWVFDERTGRMYEEDTSIHMLIALGSPVDGRGGPPSNVPDEASTVGLTLLALGGLVLMRRKQTA